MTCLDDATVLGLVEGRLAPSTLADVDAHLDQCASCRDVITHVAGARSQSRVLSRGDTVGRFVIGELLGSGAMGRVYSAWEPELDRRVALKMLIEDGTIARDRLVREAQAMARLSHPNVVTVHEVGTTDAGVFVAMELVDGEPLRSWALTPRPWREVAAVLAEIARGLAAVHAAGVVHRDVKPDNTIVGRDGRVRLGDFGLARSGSTGASSALAVGTDTSVAGTPVYMAPEVLRGGAATAASDQFSFGVMAYELLAGRRPFVGTTWSSLLEAIEAGDVRPLDAPGWLEALVGRCLWVDPARRFSSMKTLGDELVARTTRQRTAPWIAAAVATALIGSAATLLVVNDDRDVAGACALANDVGWTPQGRARVGFLGEPVLLTIDRWAAAWQSERRDTCEAAAAGASLRVAARETCLERRRDELVALVERFEPTSTDRALDALSALAPPQECRSAVVDASDPLPLDPQRAASARHVIDALPSLRAAIAIGDARGALMNTASLVERARTADHAPTLAEILLVHAEALRGVDRLVDAATAARDAVAAAVRGRAELTGARAWLARIAVAGDRRELGSTDDLGPLAAAAVERAGSPPHLTATLQRLRGLVAYNRGQLAEARTLLLDARVRFVALSGSHSLDVSVIESSLGSVARQGGELDEAERRHRAALAIDTSLRGKAHRDLARDHHNIAGVLRLRGELDAALVEYRKALAIEIATPRGDSSIAAGLTHNSIGLVLMATQEWAAARAELELARATLAAAGHGDVAFTEHNLGLVAQRTGAHRDALEHFERAAAIYARTIGTASPAADRLAADRAVSAEAQARRRPATRPTAPQPIRPAAPATAPASKPAQDVGVYGSAQTW